MANYLLEIRSPHWSESSRGASVSPSPSGRTEPTPSPKDQSQSPPEAHTSPHPASLQTKTRKITLNLFPLGREPPYPPPPASLQKIPKILPSCAETKGIVTSQVLLTMLHFCQRPRCVKFRAKITTTTTIKINKCTYFRLFALFWLSKKNERAQHTPNRQPITARTHDKVTVSTSSRPLIGSGMPSCRDPTG